MTQTTNNHYSPVFSNQLWANKHGLIRSFKTGSTGDIVRGRTGPVEWGAEKHLYPQELEDALAKFEHRVKRLYHKLIKGELLDPVERVLWSRWILCQFSRTPSFMIELAKLEEDVLSSFPDFSDFAASIDVDAKFNAALENIQSISSGNALLPFIVMRDWIVLRPAPGEFFVKSDVPVVIQGALVNDDAMIVYPLAPDRCFIATVLDRFPPTQVQEEYQLRPRETEYYLRLVASCADLEVICHPDSASSSLELLLQETLGTSSKFFNISKVPEW
jgi:hypothetical protein